MDNFNFNCNCNCSYSTMLRGETKSSLEDLVESVDTYWSLLINGINNKAKAENKDIPILEFKVYLNSADRTLNLFEDVYIIVDYHGEITFEIDTYIDSNEMEICAYIVKKTKDYLEL